MGAGELKYSVVFSTTYLQGVHDYNGIGTWIARTCVYVGNFQMSVAHVSVVVMVALLVAHHNIARLNHPSPRVYVAIHNVSNITI